MGILVVLLTIVDVLIALLIIALVLVQQSKSGGGLGSTFGGGGSDSLFGAHASTHLSRLTVWFATVFIIITLALAIISAHRPKQKSIVELNSMLAKPAQTQTVTPNKKAEKVELSKTGVLSNAVKTKEQKTTKK
ncbi:MAG TPA: preprotein translocase subunit SecG [Victivallales bacterium]|nr:preprotein translocase subunit SecG [Victivallales bacterium]